VHHLTIDLTPAHGALVRILSLAERRGWAPLAVATSPLGGLLRLSLTVQGERPVELLMHQLHKLYDVQSVALAERMEVAA
jgi:acetolactate synthase II small subunit